MAEWLKAAVLKTVVRKYRGFKSYLLRHLHSAMLDLMIEHSVTFCCGEVAELAEGARLLSECMGKLVPRVRIPPSPPFKTGGIDLFFITVKRLLT